MSQPLLFENHPNDSRIKLCEGRSNALNARMGTGGGQCGHRAMENERITLTEKRFFKWCVDDISVSLRAKSGSYGGGSEVIVIESNQNHATIKDTETCPCLPASMGLGGGMCQ